MHIEVAKSIHVDGIVNLQKLCFPSPFPEDCLWTSDHIERHLATFPLGQFVAIVDGIVVGSASSLIITEESWRSHSGWMKTTGGFLFENHHREGTTLYGADISVHPAFRGRGIAKQLYLSRFELVVSSHLERFGTACRTPGWLEWQVARRDATYPEYCLAVVNGLVRDRTLTPLLRCGLQYHGVIENYMEDNESGDGAALLEWKP